MTKNSLDYMYKLHDKGALTDFAKALAPNVRQEPIVTLRDQLYDQRAIALGTYAAVGETFKKLARHLRDRISKCSLRKGVNLDPIMQGGSENDCISNFMKLQETLRERYKPLFKDLQRKPIDQYAFKVLALSRKRSNGIERPS